MKANSISLEQARAHHTRQEEEAMRRYGDALRDWDRARDRLEAVTFELKTVLAQLQEKIMRHCPVQELAELRACCKALDERKAHLEKELKKARNHASARFTALVLARQARATMDRIFGGGPARPKGAAREFQLSWN